MWCIHNLFWGMACKYCGNANEFLIFEYFTTYNIYIEQVLNHSFIKILPPNVTNIIQPAYMGKMASTKIGYKKIYLVSHLDIYDATVAYS